MIPADEAKGRQRAQYTQVVQSCEKDIDRAIDKADDLVVTCNLTGPLSPGVVEALTDLYEAGGWLVKFDQGSDQRDGAWCTATLRPRARS